MIKKIKEILKSVRQYKKYAIITPLFMVGEALIECLLPFIMSMFIDVMNDNVTTFKTFSDIVKPVLYTNRTLGISFYISVLAIMLIMVGGVIVSIICGILGGRYAAKASVGLASNLRHDLYQKIQTFSFSNIDKFNVSSLITRMTTDVGNVQMSFQMCIRIVVRAPLMMIFSAVMAFISGGQMAWIFVVLVPLVGVGLIFIIKGAMSIFRVVFKKYDKLNESVQENVSAMRVVKSYVREEFEKEKFNKASNEMAGQFIKGEKIVALNNPLMNTTIHLSNILIIGLGSYFIFRTKTNPIPGVSLTIGQMSSLLTYGIQILMNVLMISMIMVMLVISLEGINRVYEVLIEEPSIKNPENPIFEIEDGSVDFNNVNFKYFKDAEKNTLDKIDIHIKSGQFIGILGSTGSGKTSVVNLISRLYDVSEGEVLVGHKNVKEYDLKALRDNVAVVLQKNVLFSGTIASNLRWGDLNATDEEMIDACKIAQADEFIQSFPDKYNTKIEQGGTNVSGGQKQRLCIARAILKHPKILILDDSTSAVDTKTDKLIRKGLKELIPNTTKIVIAQRISSIENADQIIIMNDGKVDAVGTHEKLLKTNAIYKEVYETQNRAGGDE